MTRVGKGLLAFGVCLALTLTAGVDAQTPKGMLGTWKANLAKSKFSPGPPPKSLTVTYSAAGESTKIEVSMVPADGPAEKWSMTAASDGKEYPVTGNPNADTISVKSIDANRSESTLKKGGKVTSVNTRVLSADGKTLTITSKGTTIDGKPREDVQVFER
jgi:hypothetical protein